jgi:hypothetical protein
LEYYSFAFSFACCLCNFGGEQACGVDKSGLEEFNWNDMDVDDAVQALVEQAKDVCTIPVEVFLSCWGLLFEEKNHLLQA